MALLLQHGQVCFTGGGSLQGIELTEIVESVVKLNFYFACLSLRHRTIFYIGTLLILMACVCVCVCVRACVRVCVRARARAGVSMCVWVLLVQMGC